MYNNLKIETLVLAFFLQTLLFFSGNQRRRTNIKSDGGYCVITVQYVTLSSQ